MLSSSKDKREASMSIGQKMQEMQEKQEKPGKAKSKQPSKKV
jgi:hypothetical protein